jgi:superfamily II DNA helicase RecQ
VRSLKLRSAHIAISSFDRPNISYQVRRLAANAFLKEITKEVLKTKDTAGSTIVYCTTVDAVEEVKIQHTPDLLLYVTASGVQMCSYHLCVACTFLVNHMCPPWHVDTVLKVL